jgi:4-hydroxy-3-polyprenylbenzoate decarboxylase
LPGAVRKEGPFGEWTGYYAGGAEESPVLEINSIMYRNDPILQGNPPSKPPVQSETFTLPLLTVPPIWNDLEAAGVPDVKGVWGPVASGDNGRIMTIVSIKQRYAGHALRAGLIAGGSRGSYMQRYVVVVDDDIDPSDTDEVLWAICTRCNPGTDIEIMRGSWSSRLDPTIEPWRREMKDYTTSKAIIIACKPYHWKDKFPQVNKASDELRNQIKQKWTKTLGIT